MNSYVVQVIQAMLAPAVMISACGLLLLSTNNKYSLIVNRVRALDEEKRKLKENTQLTDLSKTRLQNIRLQLKVFRKRIGCVRNAVFFYSIAVAFFILNSITIGAESFLQTTAFNLPAFGLFACGMLSVLTGVINSAFEVFHGYRVIIIEIDQLN